MFFLHRIFVVCLCVCLFVCLSVCLLVCLFDVSVSLMYLSTKRYFMTFSITKKPCKVIKGAKIRHRYNQVPHLTQDSNGKVTNSQLDTTNESQEVGPFPAHDHKAPINRRAERQA